MKPEELDELLNGELDDVVAQPRRGSEVGDIGRKTGQGPLRRGV
jgi:hypothetical protein